MIVVDASVLAAALTDDSARGRNVRTTLGEHTEWAAPGLLFFEVTSAIRGRALGGRLDEKRAQEAVHAMRSLLIEYVPPADVVERIWHLRANVSVYDAAYVATAELRDCPLVTADTRLARATGPRCEIHVVTAASG